MEDIRCCNDWENRIRVESGTGGEKRVYEFQESGTWMPVHGFTNSVHESQGIADKIFTYFISGAWVVVVLGMGFGYAVRHVLRQLEEKQRNKSTGLVVLEPRIEVLRAACEWEDITDILASPRCIFAFGSQCAETCLKQIDEHALFVFSTQRVAFHAGCGIESLQRTAWINETTHRISQLIMKKQSDFSNRFLTAQKKYGPKTDARMFPKTVWAQTVADAGAANVPPHFSRWVLQGFEHCGWKTDVFAVKWQGFSLLYEAIRHFHEHLPSLIVSVNASSSFSARFADSYSLPRVVWLIDHPALQPYDVPYHPNDHIFTFAEDFVETAVRAGTNYHGVLHCGVSPDSPRGQMNPAYQARIGYVGSLPIPVRIFNEFPSVFREYIQLISDYLLTGELNGYDLFEKAPPPQHYGVVLDLFRSHDALRPYLKTCDMSQERAQYWALLFAGYVRANFRKRTEAVRALLPLGCKVYGHETWLEVLREWGKAELYGGAISSRQDLADLYVSCDINLCINSAQPGNFINPRVFDVPAMGGFVLSDSTPALPEVFQKGENAAWYGDEADLVEKVQTFLDSPQRRIQIRDAARQEIMLRHTFAHRVEEIVHRLGMGM
jgi:glycosyltransferase involved in cell wall biosynthesis